MADFVRDLRYGLRQIPRSPSFFAIAASLIALGIAATTQIFTLVDALLLRPLPVRDPHSLIQLFEQQPKRPAEPYFDYGFYRQLARDSATLFELVGQIETTRSLEANGRAERVHVVAVTGDFFSKLAVGPILGRVLAKSDDHAVVLSYGFWSRRFGRDPKILGQIVRLQDHSYTVVGVTDRAFTGTTLDSSPDLWMPYANLPDFSRKPDSNMDRYVIEIVGRLRFGVTNAQAQQETSAFWTRYRDQAALDNTGDYHGLRRGRLEVHSITHGVSPIREQAQTALLLLLSGTGLLMLIVCANVGGLLLSRAVGRERETAIRVALGASRGRIVRQWLIESLLLTVIGGCAGLIVAYASLPLLMRAMPPAHGIGFDPSEMRTLALHPQLDLRAAAYSLAIGMFTAVICALAPAWRSWRSDVNIGMKSSATGDRKNHLFQAVLCGFQIALCTALLVPAGLVVRSLSNLRTSSAGFDREHVTVFSIDPHVRGYDSQGTWKLQERLLNGARNLPGVAGAALADRALMRGIGLGTSIVFPGESAGSINSSFNSVSPQYFDVMRIPLLAGRDFNGSDVSESQKVSKAIVNEAFVRKFLPGRNPLGEKFATGQKFVRPEYEIIGVVGDTKYRSLREVPPPILYTNHFGPEAYPDTFILHVRSKSDPHAIIRPVRELLRSIDPELPLHQVATLSEEVDQSLWQERLLATLISGFAAFALTLSAIGVYGVLAYFVTRRRREIGLRMALGANTRQVVWLIAGRVMPILGFGILAGLAFAWLASKSMRSLLYGMGTVDPVTNIAAILLFLVIGAGAMAAPAFRAIRLDPATTLREE